MSLPRLKNLKKGVTHTSLRGLHKRLHKRSKAGPRTVLIDGNPFTTLLGFAELAWPRLAVGRLAANLIRLTRGVVHVQLFDQRAILASTVFACGT